MYEPVKFPFLLTSCLKTFQSDSGQDIRTKNGHQQAKGTVSGFLSGHVFGTIPFKYSIDFRGGVYLFHIKIDSTEVFIRWN